MPKLFWIGLAILVVGTAPFIIIMIMGAPGVTNDPDLNPGGLGTLFDFSFLGGIALMAIGVLQAVRRGTGK